MSVKYSVLKNGTTILGSKTKTLKHFTQFNLKLKKKPITFILLKFEKSNFKFVSEEKQTCKPSL